MHKTRNRSRPLRDPQRRRIWDAPTAFWIRLLAGSPFRIETRLWRGNKNINKISFYGERNRSMAGGGVRISGDSLPELDACGSGDCRIGDSLPAAETVRQPRLTCGCWARPGARLRAISAKATQACKAIYPRCRPRDEGGQPPDRSVVFLLPTLKNTAGSDLPDPTPP